MGWTHRGDAASGRNGRNGAARLPQSVPEHCDKGSEDGRMNSLREGCNWGEEFGEERRLWTGGKESFAVGGRIGFSGLALSRFGV